MKNIIPSALQTMSLQNKECSHLSCSLSPSANNAKETSLLSLGSHPVKREERAQSAVASAAEARAAVPRQRAGNAKQCCVHHLPPDSTSCTSLPRKGLGCQDLCCVHCCAQFIAFGCAGFRFCLTASEMCLVMNCIEKCKEAFNSKHLRLFSLCIQTETC